MAQSWIQSYKPSLNSGTYGCYAYSTPLNFYPQKLSYYIEEEKNSEYYIFHKFEKRLRNADFDCDNWYKYIIPYTFTTKFINIHPKYAKAIVTFYRYRYCKANINTMNINIINNLRELQTILDSEIKSLIAKWFNNNDTDKGVFIRFSNRSPKDGHKLYVNKDESTKLMNDIINKLVTDNTDNDNKDKDNNDDNQYKFAKNDPNTKFIAFCKASAKDLFVNNGNDAMSLILSSERVFTDLMCVITAHKFPYKYLYSDKFTLKQNNMNQLNNSLKWNGNKWEICNVSIAIRKWDNRIRDDLEFRCFVFDSKLRAISQYNHYCYFPYIALNKKYIECIKNAIIKYFNQYIKDKLPFLNYVIDIGIIDNRNDYNNINDINYNLKCIVIELNPFQNTTGCCLFDWNKDEQQLKYGTNIEMRVHNKPKVNNDFVDHYLNDFQTYSVEKKWYQLLNDVEMKLKKDNQQTANKLKDCILL